MAGQNHHFKQYAREKLNYAIGRYVNEINRLHAVFNKHLADRAFVAGEYSIAGMAAYPWIVPHESQGRNLRIFRISNAGSRRSVRVPRLSAPIPERRKSIRRRSSGTRNRAKSSFRGRQRM
jgi:glutathione S-transferase